MKERLHFIDTYKGILMLLVVWGHINYYIYKCTGEQNDFAYCLQQFHRTYIASFFMAAFFVATGFCMKSGSNIKTVITKGLKSLILPGITIPLLMRVFKSEPFVLSDYLISLVKGQNIPWFLAALFWARCLFFYIQRIKNVWLRLLALFTFMMTGAILINKGVTEYWSSWHGLVMTVFLELGVMANRYKDWLSKWQVWTVVLGALVSLHLLWQIAGLYVPAFCAIQAFSWKGTPAYLLFATLGSVATLCIARLINENKALEYVGRNTLVFYLVHTVFFILLLNIWKTEVVSIQHDIVWSVILWFVMMVGSLLWSILWSEILNMPKLQWLLGRW